METLVPGIAVEIAAGVRRLVAPNPGMMTGPGTNTYLLGYDQITVIDPGPALDVHVAAILAAAGEKVEKILVTHTHPDHSPAANPLAGRTGAPCYGLPAPNGPHQDASFNPDFLLHDGDIVTVDGFQLRVLHTPGHASNHLCYLREDDGLLFTGDQVIDGSTVVIDPPDGNMQAYLDSLARLKSEPVKRIAPGHGVVLEDPKAVVDWIIAHRLEREQKVLAALLANPDCSLSELTGIVYAAVAKRLLPVAERSMLAHLEKLRDDARAIHSDGRWRATD